MNPAEVKAVIGELRTANENALRLIEQAMISQVDGDEWKRFPNARGRCPISNLSRRQIYRLADEGLIKTKHVGRARFYSGHDLRKFIQTKNNDTA